MSRSVDGLFSAKVRDFQEYVAKRLSSRLRDALRDDEVDVVKDILATHKVKLDGGDGSVLIHLMERCQKNYLSYEKTGGHNYAKLAQNVKALLAAGADVNATNAGGDTALHMAVRIPMFVPVIQVLLNAGADSDIKNNDRKTARDEATALAAVHIDKKSHEPKTVFRSVLY